MTATDGRTVILLAVLVLLAGCSAVQDLPVDIEVTGPGGDSVQVTVQYVIDGDTIVVVYPDGHEETVRLLGVDTPETGDTNPVEFEGVPDTAAGRACLRGWAENARTYLTDRLAGRTVTLEFDALADRRGYYDRLLAYVVVENTTINRRLIAAGYARLYDSEFESRLRYASLEQQAQADRRGVWQCRDP
ncbi:MAG: thermonuclease family protein [Halobacteriaceae archaeon]